MHTHTHTHTHTHRATGEVTFEWLHNNEPILSRVTQSTGNLQLLIQSVGLQDSGEYTCRANLSDGRTIGPNSADTLTVLGKHCDNKMLTYSVMLKADYLCDYIYDKHLHVTAFVSLKTQHSALIPSFMVITVVHICNKS